MSNSNCNSECFLTVTVKGSLHNSKPDERQPPIATAGDIDPVTVKIANLLLIGNRNYSHSAIVPAIFGRWRHLMQPTLLLITNQTKLTQTIALNLTDTVMQTNKTKLILTVTLTLTDTVTVIFFTRILLTSIKS